MVLIGASSVPPSCMKVSFIVSAHNLSKESVTLDLTDRIPVTQDEDIELDDVEIPKGARQHSDGLIKWTATLKLGTRNVSRTTDKLDWARGSRGWSQGDHYHCSKGRRG